ncbi:heavy metal translocating P-type ATPase [Pelomonas sp. PFR6]|uniref:P-type Zn(2+) transporter n=2 Tax=Roseateles violae TaxID=3058042 RepID=A0ABT8DTK4_9BURK|nr:heavy metal translocating P-type ATPase [Pelomonas sp. PFR6]MDN3920355.1 heavy metal translocating P-type ATPase [Pelomonas sp. PFR6]
MDCAVEEGQIRRALERFASVRRLRFDLAGRTLGIDAPVQSWDEIAAAIAAAGFEAQRIAARPPAEDRARARRAELWRLLAALAVALGAELIHFLAPPLLAWQLLGMAVAAGAIALSGLAVFRKGLSALRRGQLNINALMSVAVSGAFLIGQWPEAAMVMALYALAELIEARSVERARDAIAGLLALSPPQAELRLADGSWALREAGTIAVGSRVRVKPGERFALDGRVSAGRGAVDQSPVTGESLPVDKQPGDEVYAGSINQSGALEFEVTRPASDSVLARLIQAVEEAQSRRAPTQRFVDRFAAIYTPAVFVLALGVALGMPLLVGWAWSQAVYKALVLLVIACPCALVISTPVTIVSGLAAAARRGILIKGGVHLEQARRLRLIALDKTGTLTEGRPKLVAQQLLSSAQPPDWILGRAQSLASRSDHPVSKALAAGLAAALLPVEDLVAEPGRGLRGRIAGGEFLLANHRWLQERGLCTPTVAALLQAQEAQGRTVSVLADASGPLALFAVADSARASSAAALAELRALGMATAMLSGDNEATARAIAAPLGIARVHAGLLPQDKQDLVARWSAAGPVGMVGDGVNDAPSLAAASLGFSLGGASTDTAKETADVLIMDDDLRKLPETIRLSRRTHAILLQNIALALGIKALFFVLAVFGNASMWMAVFADMGASLLVVFNGLRLLRGVRR